MLYGEKLGERKKVRRVTFKEFGKAGVSPPYIHQIISRNTLPGIEVRDAIGTFMGQVAIEQNGDALEEQRILREAWWWAKLEELEVNPDIVPAVATLLSASEEQQMSTIRLLEEALQANSEKRV
jgi:hypothetical protein